jgi:hypothetical protein
VSSILKFVTTHLHLAGNFLKDLRFAAAVLVSRGARGIRTHSILFI